jgi:dephospho-CoA kinase
VRGHVSEDGASKLYWDYTIINDGSIEKLRKTVKLCLNQLEEMTPSKSKKVAA